MPLWDNWWEAGKEYKPHQIGMNAEISMVNHEIWEQGYQMNLL